MMTTNLIDDLRQLNVETFEVEDINDLGLDAPAILIGDDGELMADAWCSSSCSCSSCCSCSTSSCCSCSTSCGSCGSCG